MFSIQILDFVLSGKVQEARLGGTDSPITSRCNVRLLVLPDPPLPAALQLPTSRSESRYVEVRDCLLVRAAASGEDVGKTCGRSEVEWTGRSRERNHVFPRRMAAGAQHLRAGEDKCGGVQQGQDHVRRSHRGLSRHLVLQGT